MKKRILIVPVLLLLLLSGCAKAHLPSSVTGKWILQTGYAELTGGIPTDAELGELAGYVDFENLKLTSVYTFHEDRTYTFKSDVEQYIRDCRDLWTDAINAYYTDQIALRNLDITVEEAWELDGVDVESLVDAEAIRAAFAEVGSQGNYKAEDGKLFLSAGREFRVDLAVYTTYELNGDTLTLLESFGGIAAVKLPATLTKAP